MELLYYLMGVAILPNFRKKNKLGEGARERPLVRVVIAEGENLSQSLVIRREFFHFRCGGLGTQTVVCRRNWRKVAGSFSYSVLRSAGLSKNSGNYSPGFGPGKSGLVFLVPSCLWWDAFSRGGTGGVPQGSGCPGVLWMWCTPLFSV